MSHLREERGPKGPSEYKLVLQGTDGHDSGCVTLFEHHAEVEPKSVQNVNMLASTVDALNLRFRGQYFADQFTIFSSTIHTMSKRIFATFCFLTLSLVLGDTHIDKKVSVKEVVFDSPVGDLVWLGPQNNIVLARTHNGNESLIFLRK